MTAFRSYISLANVRDHRWLAAADSVPGAKRPSTECDAGRYSVDRIVRVIPAIENGCLAEADKPESETTQEHPGWPPAEPPEHGRGWPPTEQPHPISHVSESDSESCRTDQCNTLSTDSPQ